MRISYVATPEGECQCLVVEEGDTNVTFESITAEAPAVIDWQNGFIYVIQFPGKELAYYTEKQLRQELSRRAK